MDGEMICFLEIYNVKFSMKIKLEGNVFYGKSNEIQRN
jgi:hypothetical protein